jgi:hypothetical protein
MKWILAVAALSLVAAFAILQRNAVKTSYVNGLPQYTALPGTEYIFQRDCYIFKLESRSTAYPLVGTHEAVPALPAEVSPAKVGAKLGEVRILDVARVGDRFKIISVRREESRKGTTISFEILFVNEAERKYPRLDAFFILDHSPEKAGEAPRVIETYAVPRVKL